MKIERTNVISDFTWWHRHDNAIVVNWKHPNSDLSIHYRVTLWSEAATQTGEANCRFDVLRTPDAETKTIESSGSADTFANCTPDSIHNHR